LANGNRWSLSFARRFTSIALMAVGLFVLCFGVGMANPGVVAIGLAVAILGPGFLMLSAIRGGAREYVFGTAHVHSASPPPTTGATEGRCELHLSVYAHGFDGVAARVLDPAVPVNKWPGVGADLPVEVAVGSVRRIRVLWEKVLTHRQAAAADDVYPDLTEEEDGSDELTDPVDEYDHGVYPPDDTPTVTDIPPVEDDEDDEDEDEDEQYDDTRDREPALVADRRGGGAEQPEPGQTVAAFTGARAPSEERDRPPVPRTESDPLVKRSTTRRRPSPHPHRPGSERQSRPRRVDPADAPTITPVYVPGPEHGDDATPTSPPPPDWPLPPEPSRGAHAAPDTETEAFTPLLSSWSTQPPSETLPDDTPARRPAHAAPEGQEPPPAPAEKAGAEPAADPDGEAGPARFLAAPQAGPSPLGAVGGVSVTLIVSDLARSITFYRDTLGLAEVETGKGAAVLASGDARILLKRVQDMTRVDRRVVHLNFEVPDVQAAYEELRAKGVEFVHKPRVVSHGEQYELWAATFRDPDGHAIALTRWETRR